MSFVETSVLKNATIMLLHSERDEIDLNPEYQRMGGVWTLSKRRLLIDSIINDYDIPKLYFHLLGEESLRENGKRFAVIDGRQRLEAIWDFLDGKFTLSPDFEYQRDPTLEMGSYTYDDIAKQYPKIRIKFDSFVLPVVTVETEGDDLDLIEDMFSRLNEAVPLNAAEKRNAIGGDFVAAINAVSAHNYFTDRVKFSSSRYKHREVSARFLLVEEALLSNKSIVDTKREYLDGIASRHKIGNYEWVKTVKEAVEKNLDIMASVFSDKDDILAAQGIQVVYYLVFRTASIQGKTSLVTRAALLSFRKMLSENREKASKDYEAASFEYLEFDRLNQQGTNDANSIKERYQTLCRYLSVIPDDKIIMSA